MENIQSIKEKHLERLELIQEEIKNFMNLDSNVKGFELHVSTVAGTLVYISTEPSLMGDVYRLIQHYGVRLEKWGLENKLKSKQYFDLPNG